MNIDPRFLTEQGLEIFNGNELILKGALESQGGVHLLAGYPGSPIAGFFDAMVYIKDLLNTKGIHAAINHNEALAAAMLNGSQSVAMRAIICMKSVGVHVAADGLALGNLAGAHKNGGAIVIYGDDPWSDSTQVPADSRYISQHLHIPTIEPSTPQEVKDFVDLAFKVSAGSELYMGYIVPTNLADGGGSVACRPNQYPTFNTVQKQLLKTKDIDLDKRVLLPPRTWWQEESLKPRHARAMRLARELGLNRIENPSDTKKPVGFITSGMAWAYLTEALGQMGLSNDLPILKLGLTYPVDGELVKELARMTRRIVVVEERRGFIESQVSEIITALRQSGEVGADLELWGKLFPKNLTPLPATRGLHPSIIINRVGKLIKWAYEKDSLTEDFTRLQKAIDIIYTASKTDFQQLPPRIPSFCPGCPHRDSANLCIEIKKLFADSDYMRKAYKRKPVELLFHGDIGCYTMLMFPPNADLMSDLSGMGLGGGTGSGTDPFLSNKEVVFMGDSTFFHCGALAISQAIKLSQDITFIILDNSTTGMTGHQTTPELDFDVLGNPTAVQNIEDVVRGLAANTDMPILRVDPSQRDYYKRVLEHTFLADGVKVIIADKECGITRTRRLRRQQRDIRKKLGYLPREERMNINTDICRYCLSCSSQTGCPGLTQVQTEYGTKMDTDITWCVNDGACMRIGACSSFEQVTIKRSKPPRSRVPELGLDDIPEPQKYPTDDIWRCCLTGVGGMGIGTATGILVRAGHLEGYEVIFLDKKGLAIRNGGVVSQIVYHIKGNTRPPTAIIPYGCADLLLGVDILEAGRTLDPTGRLRVASPERTAAVINTDEVNTIGGIISGKSMFDVEELEKLIHQNTRSQDYLARNISRICETYLGSKLYANIMMIGFAFQKGLIPVSKHSIAWAIKHTIRSDFRKNLYAFNMGRKLVVDPNLFQGAPQLTGWQETLEDKYRWTVRRYKKDTPEAKGLLAIGREVCEKVINLDEPLKRDVVIRLYDCVRFGGLDYASEYARAVMGVYEKDSPAQGYRATGAVIRNLADAMLYKDIVFVAELATHPAKKARDRKKYNVNPANGDRIRYKHYLHWRLNILGVERHFSVAAGSGMLKKVRNMRWLRKLPGWRKADREFLKRYGAIINDFPAAPAENYATAASLLEAPRCLKCFNPECKLNGCPLGNDAKKIVDLITRGKWKKAFKKLTETDDFAELTCLICPAPCQDACNNALNAWPVDIKRIEASLVEMGLKKGWFKPHKVKHKSGKSAAVIGSGPAGLAAAQKLSAQGHEVTVFERDEIPGGLLQYGIPASRLDKQIVANRIELLKKQGVSFTTSIKVGYDLPADQLAQKFDAICLACGSTKPRDLDLPGRNLGNIVFALDFLRDGSLDLHGKKVLVIGAGDTGLDCGETALARGAFDVNVVEILPREKTRTDSTHNRNENINISFKTRVKEFEGSNGTVESVVLEKIEWNHVGGSATIKTNGQTYSQSADMVVIASGFVSSMDSNIAAQLGLRLGDHGRLDLEAQTTSRENVFAAGDLETGPAIAARAVASGYSAADKIDAYLKTKQG